MLFYWMNSVLKTLLSAVNYFITSNKSILTAATSCLLGISFIRRSIRFISDYSAFWWSMSEWSSPYLFSFVMSLPWNSISLFSVLIAAWDSFLSARQSFFMLKPRKCASKLCLTYATLESTSNDVTSGSKRWYNSLTSLSNLATKVSKTSVVV